MRKTYKNGGCYEGDGRGNLYLTGYGEESYANGYSYKGFYLDGYKQGYGREYYNGRLMYLGEWYNNCKQGCGRQEYKNGQYIGYFVNGQPCGFGVFFYGNGSVYVGEWKECHRHGKGTYIDTEGNRLEAWWQEDKAEGICFYVNKNGCVERRDYENGTCQRENMHPISPEERNYYDVSGFYGMYYEEDDVDEEIYGKIRNINGETVSCGMSLSYVTEDNWTVSFLEDGYQRGEVISYWHGNFVRRFLDEPMGEGILFWYSERAVGFGCSKGLEQNGFGISYVYGKECVFGDFVKGGPMGRGLCCSADRKRVYVGDYNGKMINPILVFSGEDVINESVTSVAARISDYTINASSTRLYISRAVQNSYGEKSESEDHFFAHERGDGSIHLLDPNGKIKYISKRNGERTYVIMGKCSFTLKADGSYMLEQINGGRVDVLNHSEKSRNRTVTMLSAPQGAPPESKYVEMIGGMYMSVTKSHTADMLAISKNAYCGSANGGIPRGKGTMHLPDGSCITGEWDGFTDCKDARYTDKNGHSYGVFVNNGCVTLYTGESFKLF